MQYCVRMRLGFLTAAAMAVFCFGLKAEIAVANADFHAHDNGKAAGWKLTGNFQALAGGGHNGSAGLVWHGDESSSALESASQRIKLEAGKSYRFTTLARTENFTGKAELCIEWYGKKGWIGGGYLKAITKKDSDWTQYVADTAPIPEDTEYCQLMYYVRKGAKGTVQFDNVAVVPRYRKPVAFVFSSAYRETADDGEVRFHAALFPPENTDVRAEFTYRDAGGRVCRVKPTSVAQDCAMLRIDVRKLLLGRQNVSCALYAKNGSKIDEAGVEFVRVGRLPVRKVAIDGHRRCLIDGKPFFPLGLYTSRFTEGAAKDLADAGFNCAMPYGITGRKELDIAARYGLKICADVRGFDPSSEKSQNAIKAIKDHPGLLAWYVNDEAPLADLPALLRRYKFLASTDAHHPVYAVMDRLHDLREFIPSYDVLGMDPYPVTDKPISHISDMISQAQKKNFHDRSFWNVPQAFAWSDYKLDRRGTRFPTEEELRSICWQHIACGANGLFGYSYFNMDRLRSTDREEADRRWRIMRRVFGEIKAAIDVLLSVETPPIIGGNLQNLSVRAWRKDAKVWLLVCNIANKPCSAKLEVGGETVLLKLNPLEVSFGLLSRLQKSDR